MRPYCQATTKTFTQLKRNVLLRGPLMSKVNIAEKFSKITEYWKPYIGAELNGQHVKFDKLKGEFVFIITKTKTKCFLL